ncbi:MAG: MFS transporter [Thermomicrobiales bacterium]
MPRGLGLFTALTIRPFALLWAGQTFSRFGDHVHRVALAWWVLEETGSAAAMGGVLAASAIPELLFLLLGGVAVDRFSRAGILLGSDMLRGVVVGVVAVLAATDRLELWHVLVAGVFQGVAVALFAPAYIAVVPDLVPDEILPSANSLRGLSRQLTGLAGPAAGGVLVATGGTAVAFAIDGLTYAIAAGCLVGVVRDPALARPAPTTGRMAGDLVEGFRTVRQRPWLWVTIVIAGVSNVTLAAPMAAALPLLVREEFGDSARVYGLLSSLLAAGAVVTAVWLGRMPGFRCRGPLTYGFWIGAALAMAALGLPVPLAIAGVAMALYGVMETGLGLVWLNAVQSLVPRDRLGRVYSIDALGSAALLPVGFAVVGVLADRFGAAPVFLAGGLTSAAIIAAGLLHPGVRGLD